ncbi:uncharacterized protein LOC130630092 [Hydractinia symbiolongicarpus]|uniref:uncharacterized protein LOC130630092 n=1 Tax=Hydractinia symbiolongicarpus TaxID=13093 RepID=UPI00254DBDFE|nr:uncharacterized protein LOC130630092 [Hydractinia symbiolongicarpus]
MNEENQSSEVEDEDQNNIKESVEAQSKKVVNEGLKPFKAARQEYDDEAVVFKYDVEVFIIEIESYPRYLRLLDLIMIKTRTSWEELSKKFKNPVEFMKIQWKDLRENLKRCLVKRSKMMKCGAAFHTLPNCKYFPQLQFLQEKVMNKKTCSNVMGSPPPVELFPKPETVSDFSAAAESPASTPSRPYAKRSSSECSSSSSKSNSSSSKKIKEQEAAQMDMHVLQKKISLAKKLSM